MDSAIELLPEHASLAEIAAHAGVVRRTVYAHYSSREDLMIAVARDIGERIADRTANIVSDADDTQPLLTLARFVYANSAAVAQLRQLGGFVSEPGVREELSAATAGVRELIGELLGSAIAAGHLDGAIPPRAGMEVAAAVQWGVFEAVAAGDLSESEAPRVAVHSVLGSIGVDHARIATLVASVASMAAGT
jgi:AcrR family transcriptional regulator